MEQLSTTAVRVSWESINLPDIAGYRVYYSRTGNRKRQSEEGLTMDVSSSENSADVSGLSSYVQYNFQVAAIAELDGVEITGDQCTLSCMTMITLAPQASTPEPTCEGSYSHKCSYVSCHGNHTESTDDVRTAIGVAVTFLLTIILYSTVLFVVCAVWRRNTSKTK